MSKRPAFQFYPSDWRNDPGLRLCSVAARGLWADMLCLMHEGAPYGHLTVLNRAMSPDDLSRLVGAPVVQVKRWLAELSGNEVYSITDSGVIYSRRMVRDEALREVRAAGGAAGAEHGHKGGSHGTKGGRPRKDKTPLTGDDKGGFKPSPSSSSPSPDIPKAKASGPEKRADPEKIMFDTGRDFLGTHGISTATAGQLLGKWKRDHGAEAVIVALGKAQREGAIDPKSFIEGCLRNGQRPRFERASAWTSSNLPFGSEAGSLD